MASRERMISAFLEGLKLAGVYIAPTRRREVVAIGPVAGIVPGMTESAGKDGAVIKFSWLFWCRRFDHAEMIATECRCRAGYIDALLWDGGLEMSPADARKLVLLTAAKFGLSDALAGVMAEAEEFVTRAETALRAMHRRGDLKGLNRAYAEYRQSCVAAGERALPYRSWMDIRQAEIVRNAAANHA